MAIPLKIKPKTLTLNAGRSLRRFSSPPDDSNGGDGNKPPSPPSHSSLFSDIKARLKSQSPPPPPFSSSSPKPGAESINDIRRHLAEFRRESSNPNPNPQLSFHDLVKNASREEPTNPDRLSYASIRESLRQSRFSPPREPTNFSSTLKSFQESLRSPSAPPLHGPNLPEGIFGPELRERKGEPHAGDGEVKRPSADFVKMYTHEELGEKLRKLRPVAAAKGKKDWFSLEELNSRLVKLREIEEKETQEKSGGFMFRDLRDSLARLKDAETKKKASMQHFSIIANIGMNATPAFMLKPPQEQLMENFFHPDHLSSAEKLKLELKKVRDAFKMSESDCGSARVQIAQLTTKIKHLRPLLHKKDKHSRKGLHEMAQRRKKLLKYLRRTDWDSYCFVLSKLGLKDTPEYKTPNYKMHN